MRPALGMGLIRAAAVFGASPSPGSSSDPMRRRSSFPSALRSSGFPAVSSSLQFSASSGDVAAFSGPRSGARGCCGTPPPALAGVGAVGGTVCRGAIHGTDRPSRAGQRHAVGRAVGTASRLSPGKSGGRPRVRGPRITVYDVPAYPASGMTPRVPSLPDASVILRTSCAPSRSWPGAHRSRPALGRRIDSGPQEPVHLDDEATVS